MHVVGQQAKEEGQVEATSATTAPQTLISYGKTSKRKRAGDAEEVAPDDAEGGVGLSFVPRKRKDKTAAAADQRDYIGFDDDEGNEEESEEEEDAAVAAADLESVSSGEEDSSDDDDSDEEDEEEDNSSSSGSSDSSSSSSSEEE